MATLDVNDTIAAIASASGNAPRGIVRISGPTTFQILEKCSTAPFDIPSSARKIDLQMRLPTLGSIDCLMFAWPTSKSFTRQPCAEIHTIGSPVILRRVLQSVIDHGARLAQHGEFTMRAFLAGRIDLTQAEAVLGVIDANNQTELQTALNQLSGGLLSPLKTLRDQLIHLISDIEAELDFVEEDIQFVSQQQIDTQLDAAIEQIQNVVEKISQRSTTDALPRIVLLGPPNAGKSTLFNRICTDSQAIVSRQAGTTRDFVTGKFKINNQWFELVDTAGINPETGDMIDAASQNKSIEQFEQATIRILCIDASTPLEGQERELLAKRNFDFIFSMKSDLPTATTIQTADPVFSIACPALPTADDELDQAFQAIFEKTQTKITSEFVPTTIARCTQALTCSHESLVRAKSVSTVDRELLAADLRLTLNQVGEIVGVVYTDDILEKIFSRFCIGK